MAEKKAPQCVLKLKTGETFDVIGETPRYWLCKGAQFKKTSREIEAASTALSCFAHSPRQERTQTMIDKWLIRRWLDSISNETKLCKASIESANGISTCIHFFCGKWIPPPAAK